jgi:hypothetical protein
VPGHLSQSDGRQGAVADQELRVHAEPTDGGGRAGSDEDEGHEDVHQGQVGCRVSVREAGTSRDHGYRSTFRVVVFTR